MVIELDRGSLAMLDRKLLAGLGQDETYRMVRVPVAAAKWSTWKRYCDSAGISMGRGIATLIDHELSGVLGDSNGLGSSVLAAQAEEELSRRQTQILRREEMVAAVEERLRAWEAHLRTWEAELETRERRVKFAAKMSAQPREGETKVGRSERCPCGPGLKYKHCHDVREMTGVWRVGLECYGRRLGRGGRCSDRRRGRFGRWRGASPARSANPPTFV